MIRPKVILITDNVKDYALKAGIDEDIVLGFVFIQAMMHAYFDSFNSKGFPTIEPLEESFSEFGMLSFIDYSPSLRRMFFPFVTDYVISKIGKKPDWGGYGIELYTRAGDDAARLISRYRKISNWTEPPIYYKNSYYDDIRKYNLDPTKDNADKVYKDILDILNRDWNQPIDPIQPAIGEPWDFDEK